MAALAMPGGGGGPRRSPITLGRAAALGGLVLSGLVVWNLMSAQLVTKRPNEMKTTQVILPPPPPPPPPEVKPEEKPLEPTDAPPIDEPVDTPPPPDQAPQQQQSSADATVGDNALTAREGAGPSSYGLAVGDGSGGRIGGRPGGSAFGNYAQMAIGDIRRAAQADRDMTRGRYRIEEVEIAIDAGGRISRVRVLRGGDDKRNARLTALLMGLQLSQRPPAGMPSLRVALNGS